MKIKISLLIFGILFLNSCDILLLFKPPVDGVNVIEDIIHSNIKNYDYVIYICLPESYYDSGINYPSAYLLDGDFYTNEVYGMAKRQANADTMKEIIIVGIGVGVDMGNYEQQKQRKLDFTPTIDPSLPTDTQYGGANLFFNFIKDELIPYIDNHFNTIADAENRCIMGHSLGGLAAYYALFNYNNTFNKFIASSPSIWWDSGIMIQYERDYSQANLDLAATIFSSVGSAEGIIMNGYIYEMWDSLKNRNYPSYKNKTEIFNGVIHGNADEKGFLEGLKFVF